MCKFMHQIELKMKSWKSNINFTASHVAFISLCNMREQTSQRALCF